MRFTTKVLASLILAAGLIGSGWFGLPTAAPVASAAPVPDKPKTDKMPELPVAAYQLLHNRKVLKELKCTPEQRVNIEDSFDELNEKQAGKQAMAFNINIAPGANPGQIQQQIEAQIKAMQDEQAKAARTVGEKYLNAAQLVRLGQIEVQQRGVEAFSDEKLVAPLKLTADQKKVVAEAIEESKPMAQVGQVGGGIAGGGGIVFQNVFPGFKDAKREKAAVEKMEAALTKEQLGEWKKIAGEKIGFELHPTTNFGGFGFGGAIAVPALPVVPPPLPPVEKKD